MNSFGLKNPRFDIAGEVNNLLQHHQSRVLTCVGIWLFFAFAETIKTLYFAYNKSLFLLYLSHALYIFLPWIVFSLTIGVAIKYSSRWRWQDAHFIIMHVTVAVIIAMLHLAILASSYLLFVPASSYELTFLSSYERLFFSWFNYELLSYFAIAALWYQGFETQQSSLEHTGFAHKAAKNDTYPLNTTAGLVPISYADIEWLQADNNYTQVRVSGRELRVRSAFKELLDTLNDINGKNFLIQTHRSAAVNIHQIELIDKVRVVTHSGSRIPISRRRYRQLLKLMSKQSS